MSTSGFWAKASNNSVPDQKRLTNIVRIGFFAVLVLGIILVSVTIYRLNDFNASMTAIVDVHNKKASLASAMRDAIRQRAVNIYTMLATDDYFLRDQEVMKFYENAGIYRKLREELVNLEMSDREKELHDQLAISTSQAQPANQRIVDLIMDGATLDEISEAVKEGLAAQRHILDLLSSLIELQNEYTNTAAERNREVYRFTRLFLLATGASVLLIGGLIARAVIRYVRDKSQELTGKNRELAEAYRQAEEATKAKSTFLANMSHEIRTPMNGVLGMLDMIRETRLSPEQKHFLETAYNSSNALLCVINDILDLSKIEAGKLSFEKIVVDIRGLVEEVVALHVKEAQEKGVELISYVSPAIPMFILGDPTRLRQILNNLISNAVKFTREGEIYVSLEASEQKGNQREYRFEVSDTGIGIPDEVQASIFETFTQADGTTTRKFGGTGLGLAICRQMTKMLGGSIGVKSEVEKGSIFWFSVPLDDVPEYEALSTNDIGSLSAAIVVLDENRVRKKITCSYLVALGASVHHLDEGGYIEDYLRKMSHDMDGIDVVLLAPPQDEIQSDQILKKLEILKNTHGFKLILIVDVLRRRHSYEMWDGIVDSYLAKPIRYSALFDTITNAVTVKSTVEEVASNGAVVSAGQAWCETAGVKRILLVEDNVINQQVASAILLKAGYEVEVAENGKEAVDLTQSANYDIIIMDCQMPIMDGMEATRIIREREKKYGLFRTPIVAITANALDGDRSKCLVAGMDDYLAKPLHKDDLIRIMKRWSESGKAQQNEDGRYCMKTIESLKETLSTVQFEEITNLFISHTSDKISSLRDALARNDVQAIESLSHSIKGSAANMGTSLLYQYSNQILQDARNGAVTNSDIKLFERLEREFQYISQFYRRDIIEQGV